MRPLPVPSTRPMQHQRARFADAKNGRDENDGSERSPWRTIGHAIKQFVPGDTLYLRDGVYYETPRIARIARADAPITIRSYPNELAVIDGGLREFFENPKNAWQPIAGNVPDYFRSIRSYPNARYMLGWFADSMVALSTYQHRIDIEETQRGHFINEKGQPYPLPIYLGPGLWYDVDSGHIHARLTHTNYDIEYPGVADYQGVRDPREIPIVISPFDAVPLLIDGAEHLILQDLVIRGAGENTVVMRDAQYVTFDNVVVYCGTYGLRSKSSGPVKFVHSALRGSIPPWFVHAAGSLRNIPSGRKLDDPEAGRNTTHRDVTRLNTHVIAAIEGRTEEMIDYAFPGNHHWEIAYSDFTDGFDGIHFGGECIKFHHNRIDRFFDDSIYLTPLTPQYLDQMHVYQNLFIRCLLPIGFGGLSDPGASPIFIYRNVIDMRTKLPSSHGKWYSNVPFVGHFRSVEAFQFGALNVYHNTIITRANPQIGGTSTQDVRRPYAPGTLAFTKKNWPRRVFNNLFVYLQGMIPPHEQTMSKPDEDVQIDGNVHVDLIDPAGGAAKLDAYRKSEFFAKTRGKYAPGWEAGARVGDAKFARFDANEWAINDYRPREGSAVANAGVKLPESWPDPLKSSDAGALPIGGEPMRVGRDGLAVPEGDVAALYTWLEKSAPYPALPYSRERLGESGSRKTTPPPASPPSTRERSDSLDHLKQHGWCRIDSVLDADQIDRSFYDAYRILATCGVIAPGYIHNGTWQTRALELAADVVNPDRTDGILDEQFYIRPAYINDIQSFVPALIDQRIGAVVEATLGKDARVTFTTLLVSESGTQRGPWHAGGPFNPDYAAHYPSPYRDAKPHLTLHVLSNDFTAENGGILIAPQSHRRDTNPGYLPREKRFAREAGEAFITGRAGSVIIADSRLWQAVAPNPSDFPRASVVVEMSPAKESLPTNLAGARLPKMSAALFDRLPPVAQKLFRDWVSR